MLILYGAGAVAAIVIAWLAALVHASGHAPLGLVSLVVGVAIGATLAKLAATQRITSAKRLIAGAIVIAILAILAEHTWLYLDFRRQWHESREKSPQVAMFRPESPWSPGEFFRNELTPERAAVWCLDGFLIIVGAVATVGFMSRPPASSLKPPACP